MAPDAGFRLEVKSSRSPLSWQTVSRDGRGLRVVRFGC